MRGITVSAVGKVALVSLVSVPTVMILHQVALWVSSVFSGAAIFG